MPKDLDSLKKSRNRRQEIISKYGDVPLSVWDITYKKENVIEYEHRKQQKIVDQRQAKMKYEKHLSDAFCMSSKNVRGKGENCGLSTFPPDLVRKTVLFYSDENDIVLDFSAGHNSRMEMTYRLNRNYIGYDPSKKFMQFNREIAKNIQKQALFNNHCSIALFEQSSEKINEVDNSVDLIFSSPPYYDCEYYGDEPEQLGNSKTYEDFLGRMKTIYSECYRVLKPNKYIAVNINDFRRDKIFYPYHADTMKLLQSVGFRLWDCIIIKWAYSVSACFASQIEDRKTCAKIHEYLVVGKKVS
jgi:DNA modification methylase